MALAIILGPRLGKYDKQGRPRAFPASNLVFVVTGTFLLLFGWMGFNPGSTLGATDLRISVVAVNTNLAAVAGSAAAMLLWYRLFGKPDITMACNGMLAGLVAITAPCAFVGPTASVIIGAVAGAPSLRRRPLQRASPKNRRPLRRHLRARLLRLAGRGSRRSLRRRHLRRRLERRRRSKLSRPRRPRRNRPTPRRRQPILDATRRRNSTSSLRLRIHVHNLQSSKRSKVNASKQRSRTTRPRRPRIRHASVPRRRSRHAHRRLASPTKVGAGGSRPARFGIGFSVAAPEFIRGKECFSAPENAPPFSPCALALGQ